MNREPMSLGLLLVIAGAYFVVRPLSIRNLSSLREWKADPESAERKQRTRARYFGGSMIIIGVAFLLYGFA